MRGSHVERRVSEVCRAGPVLIATDFDGTLTDIVPEPGAAALQPSVARVLQTLASSTDCLLMVISGRQLPELRERVSVAAVLGGNHGLQIEGRGFHFEHAGAEALKPRLAEICISLRQLLPRWPGAWLEDKGFTATVHYRAVAEREQYSLVLAVRRCLVSYGRDLGLRAGKKALEIHPRVGWSKGQAVNWLRNASGIDACICIGDDRTDETMFRECPGAISVVVGNPPFTAAQYLVQSPAQVEELLCCASEALLTRQNASSAGQ